MCYNYYDCNTILKFPYKTSLLLLFYLILTSQHLYATHIVGGDFECNYLREENGFFVYEIKLIMYRDCSPPGSEGPHPWFSDTARVGIFEKNTNNLFELVRVSTPVITSVYFSKGCFETDTVCIEKGIYRKEIKLPPNPNGYYFVWENGWRNKNIKNIIKPLETGIVFYCETPDPSLKNSTPKFTNEPMRFMCTGVPFFYNFKGTDADGDSLVFLLDTPLSGTADSSVAYPEPTPAPHKTIAWKAGYDLSNVMGSAIPLTIDRFNGDITVTPDSTGIYVLAVRMEEYRNGKLIGVNRREVQFWVVDCPPINPPYISTDPKQEFWELGLNETQQFNVVGWDSLNINDTLTLTAEGVGFNLNTTSGFNFQEKKDKAIIKSPFSVTCNCNNIRDSIYTVKLIVINTGCPDLLYDTLLIKIKMVDFEKTKERYNEINVFTPNADGKNDVFNMKRFAESPCTGKLIRYQIFNRWGVLVYNEPGGKEFVWDGSGLHEGVYYYLLYFDSGDVKSGWIFMGR